MKSLPRVAMISTIAIVLLYPVMHYLDFNQQQFLGMYFLMVLSAVEAAMGLTFRFDLKSHILLVLNIVVSKILAVAVMWMLGSV
ncbi:hypothetical protein AB4254_11685 [Vibrio breoganii]